MQHVVCGQGESLSYCTKRKPLALLKELMMQTLAPAGNGVLLSCLCRAFVSGTHLDPDACKPACAVPRPSAECWKEQQFLPAPPLPSAVTKSHLHSWLWGWRFLPQGCPPKRFVKMGLGRRKAGPLCLLSEVLLSEQALSPGGRVGGGV